MLEAQDERHIYSDKLKLPELVQWLKPYALPSKLVRDESNNSELYFKHAISSHPKLLSVKTYQDFQKKVLDAETAAIVYFSPENDKPNI